MPVAAAVFSARRVGLLAIAIPIPKPASCAVLEEVVRAGATGAGELLSELQYFTR